MTEWVKLTIESVEGGVARDIDHLLREASGDDNICLEDLTTEELDDIDNNIFTCDVCNWTLPLEAESDDEGVCEDCYEENEYEEEEN